MIGFQEIVRLTNLNKLVKNYLKNFVPKKWNLKFEVRVRKS
jgi:hypothetical protein